MTLVKEMTHTMICDRQLYCRKERDDKTMIILVKYVLHLYISKQKLKKSLFATQTF